MDLTLDARRGSFRFAKKVRTGEIPDIDFDRLRLRFFDDVRNRVVTPVRILNAHFQAAGDLIARHAGHYQSRTALIPTR